MKKKSLTTLALTSAVLFVILFYKKSLGINLFLFEAVLIPIMLYVNRPVKLNLLTGSVLFATGVSAIFTVIVNTSWGIFVNFLLLFCLGYVLAFPKGKSFFHAAWGTFLRCFSAQIAILQPNPKEKTPLNPNTSLKRKVHNFFFFVLIPVAILLFFFSLYVSSSSIFSKSVQPFLDEIAKIFTNLEFSLFFFFILGIIVVNPLLMNTKPLLIYNQDVASSDELKRTRTKRFLWFLTVALKTQNKTGIVLLSMLNVLILFFNYIDIANIWIGFEWNGAFLKEFVHEGTWLLLFSVFISAVIALYFFNSNLNFYSKNRLLKRLTVLWIAQNLIMTISVVIRNFYYINYFGLAYKRIAVLFVLVLVVVGLVTIIIKILKVKSSYFLWHINGFSLLGVLTVSALFNWDIIITKYNFAHYNRSFIEYRFIHKLSNAALPYATKTLEQLAGINDVQVKTMPFDIYEDYFWSYEKYYELTNEKKDAFLKTYESRSMLEWNLPDYQAFKKLSSEPRFSQD